MKDTYVARVRDALPRGLCFRQQAWRGLIWPKCPSLHGLPHKGRKNWIKTFTNEIWAWVRKTKQSPCMNQRSFMFSFFCFLFFVCSQCLLLSHQHFLVWEQRRFEILIMTFNWLAQHALQVVHPLDLWWLRPTKVDLVNLQQLSTILIILEYVRCCQMMLDDVTWSHGGSWTIRWSLPFLWCHPTCADGVLEHWAAVAFAPMPSFVPVTST